METIKSLKKFAIILLLLNIIFGIFSIIEILNMWSNSTFNIFKYQLIDSKNLTLSDKTVFTVYQLLNVSIIIPAYWFYTISKSISKGVFFESFVIKPFQQIGYFLYAVSAIALFFPRFFNHDKSIQESLWYDIHPTFIILIATLFLSFAVILKEAKKQKEENELTI
ncbi:hypothetical protein [Avrilella dinanensis]|uniref:hypothetical protein n=1 Tax=Avrilella dinanensis TaxID=2008672 RepID=UPI002409B5F5|nr:hypothetical protein [Avrilella dinanensis]